MPKAEPIAVRLFRYLLIQENDCWVWYGSCCRGGYGHLKRDRQRTMMKVHILAYELFIGPVPQGLFVCHRCDNPPCCNPDHLFLGTPKDNVQDCIAKGRKRLGKIYSGDEHSGTRVSVAQREEIRLRHIDGEHQADLATEFGVTQTRISQIILGKGNQRSYAKYRDSEIDNQIRTLLAQGMRQTDIAGRFGIGQSTVSRIHRAALAQRNKS